MGLLLQRLYSQSGLGTSRQLHSVTDATVEGCSECMGHKERRASPARKAKTLKHVTRFTPI